MRASLLRWHSFLDPPTGRPVATFAFETKAEGGSGAQSDAANYRQGEVGHVARWLIAAVVP